MTLAGAPNIDTATVEELVNYLRDKRIYLSINVHMMWVEVKRTYRIWEQPETDSSASLLEAVRMAARRGYEAISEADKMWDSLGQMAAALHKPKGAT